MSVIRRNAGIATAAACCGAILAPTAGADGLDIADQPLFVTDNVKPNIVMAVDDSGSMDSEVIFPTNDGALWWNTSRRSFTDSDANLNFNDGGGANGTWKKYVYLFPNGTGTGERIYPDRSNDHYAIPPIAELAYARSPAFNAGYFDPDIDYEPWVGTASKSFGEIDPENAPSDPDRGGSDFNLTANRIETGNDETFRMHRGMRIPPDTDYCFSDESNCSNRRKWRTTGPDGRTLERTRDVAFEYFPATFYLPDGEPLSDGFGYTAEPTVGYGPAGERLLGYQIVPANFDSEADYDAMIGNFANWFSYFRKRHLAVRGGIVHAFEDIGNVRAGSCTINDRDTIDMHDLENDSDRSTLYDTIYGYVDSGGTPNRQAMRHLGDQIASNTDIIQHPCQQSFAILFTDGYATTWDGAGVGNRDGDDGEPFADEASNTMADIAMYFYEELANLDHASTFEKGRVPTPSGCDDANPDPRLDCNDDLHASTFGVTLGQKGFIFGTDSPSADDPFESPPDWARLNFGNRGPSQIDDLWHAAINSRGKLLNANTPQEVADKFARTLSEIAARAGSASSLSINTGTISTDSRLYQASFTSGRWSGNLQSRPISDGNGTCNDSDTVGDVCDAEWSAATEMNGQSWDTGREIITANGSGTAVPFRHGQLPSGLQSTLSADEIAYLRGDRGNEQQNGGSFRERDNPLGDIVHSSPAFVGGPNRLRYPVDWEDKRTGETNTIEDQTSLKYRAPGAGNDFIRERSDRTPMVYVGANDGMLHGFDADTGREKIGYIPESVHSKLDALTAASYSHRFLVDGDPTVTDAVLETGGGPAWRTVLVSGLRAGGRGMFALDVTEPSRFDEGNADDIFLWEFDANDDGDLGLTYSEPAIVRLHNGHWGAVFGNGYNNTGSETAVLFVLDLTTGDVIAKIDTKAGPGNGNPAFTNGLNSVFPVDLDGDFVTDYIYAADLFGNIWKFDMLSSDPASWGVGFGTDSAPEPLFTARDVDGSRQPITVKPVVGAHPFGLNYGVMVYFGTGKYLENGDGNADTSAKHSVYGVWDLDVFTFTDDDPDGAPFSTSVKNGFGRDRLTRQTIEREVTDDGRVFRVVSQNAVQYQQADDGGTGGSDKRGWVLDLPANTGEMVVSDATLRGKVVTFSSLIPSRAPCAIGGSGFFMVIDAATGGRTEFEALDVNKDRRFTDTDTVTTDDGERNPSGIRIDDGAPGRAGFALSRETATDIAEVPVSNATIRRIDVNAGYLPEGRRSWRELRR